MIEIYDDATLAAALAAPLDAACRDLVDRIVSDARASGLWEMTCIIVVDPSDDGKELEGVLGFDPLIGPLGRGEAGEFLPWWSWIENRDRYIEVLHLVGDFAYFLLVPDFGPDRSGLAALCREHCAT